MRDGRIKSLNKIGAYTDRNQHKIYVNASSQDSKYSDTRDRVAYQKTGRIKVLCTSYFFIKKFSKTLKYTS
jgi:hypothetical protein